MSGHPVFAVVGRVNKGKSSIIATLAEDDDIEISAIPGTTRRAQGYPVQVDGETLFELVDTPGFEDAPGALAWLREHETSAADRARLVRDFIAAHAGTDEFVEERELLGPIMDGAAILYVVDGTKPYRKNYEDEMEILRWTGQPKMALINKIGEEDHSEDWRRALMQYFNVVRDFDAHEASFTDRLALLRPFQELFSDWREKLERLIDALEKDRAHRRDRVAAHISALLERALSFTLETRIEDQSHLEAERERLEKSFHDALREMERKARSNVELLYRHKLRWSEPELSRPVLEQDLFAKKTWELFGLSAGKLLTLYTLSGATVGGLIDAGVGGISFGTGALLGAGTGAAMGLYQLKRRFARAASADGFVGQFKRAFSKGQTFRIGPHAHPNFPFVLLDRALTHYLSVSARAHARRDEPKMELERSFSQELPEAERKALHKLFERLRRSEGDPGPKVQAELRQRIRAIVERVS